MNIMSIGCVVRAAVVGAAAVATASCCTVGGYYGQSEEPDGAAPPQITAEVNVLVTRGPAGRFAFAYTGEFTDGSGNLDFRKGNAYGRAVKIDFAIAPGSISGIRFKSRGEDALWIAEKEFVDESGCPTGPYRGDQFEGFETQAGGQRMHVIDKNDDQKLYRYALRFDLNGETVVDDPDLQNDGER